MGGAVTACDECAGEGEYTDVSQSAACKLAPAGYKPKTDRTGIEQCPKNTFSIGAADTCTICADGGHAQPGSFACENCLTGKYYDDVLISCALCPKDTYSESGAANITLCKACESDEYALEGSGYCKKCTSGTYYEEVSNSCLDCPSGTSTPTGGVGLNTCVKCQEGFYSSTSGAATCLNCVPGKYTNVDQTECLQCPAGKISGVASSSCTVCEIGKFAEGKSNVECSFCNDEEVLRGSTTATNSTTSALGCICPAGEFENNNTASCERVREGVREDVEGMNITTLNLKQGYWRTAKESFDVLHCLGEHHCAGGSDMEAGCEKGYEGPLCAVCSEGYAAVGSRADLECNECTGSAVMTIGLGFGIVGLFILAICVWCYRSARGGEEQALADLDNMEQQANRLRSLSEAVQDKVEGESERRYHVSYESIFLTLCLVLCVRCSCNWLYRRRTAIRQDFLGLFSGCGWLKLRVWDSLPADFHGLHGQLQECVGARLYQPDAHRLHHIELELPSQHARLHIYSVRGHGLDGRVIQGPNQQGHHGFQSFGKQDIRRLPRFVLHYFAVGFY